MPRRGENLDPGVWPTAERICPGEGKTSILGCGLQLRGYAQERGKPRSWDVAYNPEDMLSGGENLDLGVWPTIQRIYSGEGART